MSSLVFTKTEVEGRIIQTVDVRVKSDNYKIGVIGWDTAWRRYVFVPKQVPIHLDWAGLNEIMEFIEILTFKKVDG